MIQIDTHVVLWILRRASRRLSTTARRLIERETLAISPIVMLELETLFERREITSSADETLALVSERMELNISATPFELVVAKARTFAWTRDPFDRLIVANAIADEVRLLTADGLILANFRNAVW